MLYIAVTNKYDTEGHIKTYITTLKGFIEAKYYAMGRYNSYLKKGWNIEYGHTIAIDENNITFRLCDNNMDTNYIDFRCKLIKGKGEEI